MAETYTLTFDWPHTDAHSVIVTGTFDNWSSSLHLQKTDSGFTGSVAAPWDTKVLYKFVVDGNWVTHPDQPTETDGSGFVNNVLHTPSKPASPPAEPKTEESATQPTEPSPAPETAPKAAVQAPSTPPQKEAELPAKAAAPVTPIKTNGATAGHTRTSTSASTAPSSPAPSTPKTQSTFPTTEGGEGGSPASKFNSVGRQKRQSFFGRLKARLTGSPEREKKREQLRSGSPTPKKSSDK